MPADDQGGEGTGLMVRLLGPVDVVGIDGELWVPATPLRRTLLALLALEAVSIVDADRLLEEAWDGEPPASGRRALRFHISKLRDEVPEGVIETHPGGYRVNATTDIQASDQVRDPAEALRLWRGQPFIDAAPCIGLEHEQHRLAEHRLTLTEQHYQQRLGNNEAPALIGDLTRLCLDHPVRESLWACLITAHYQTGNPADALRAYVLLTLK